MKYSLEDTAERQKERQHRKNMRTVHRHLALFPKTCCTCGREFQFEVGYRVRISCAFVVLINDFCNDCAASREDACHQFYESEAVGA